MRAVWLSSTYYLDEAVNALSANAERMLTRSMAYCGNAETSGYVSEVAITMLGLPNPKKLARELVEANIYVPRPGGGWDFRSWESWNSAGDALLARRKADRERQARLRAEKKSRGQSRDAANRLDADGSLYSSVERENNRDLPTSTAPFSENGRRTETRSDMGDVENTSRNMSRDVTAPEESREEKNSGDVIESATEPYGAGISATPGADLVRAIIPNSLPSAVRTGLRIQTNALLKQGHSRADLTAALQLWLTKTGVGPRLLPSLLADVMKTRGGHGPPSANGLTVGESKVAGWAALGQSPNPNGQKAISQ